MATTIRGLADSARTWAEESGFQHALEGFGHRRETPSQETPSHPRVRLGALALAVIAGGLLARGLRRLGARRLTGLGAGRRAVDVTDGIDIAAPVDRVFRYWERFDNFPRFMPSVLQVRDLGNNRSHWTVAGPAGRRVEWDAVLTVDEPTRLIGWKTLPGSVVEHAGIVRFTPIADGTHVEVRLSYNPPGGALGHGIARLLHTDPLSHMRMDLGRMRDALESGQRATE